MEHLDPEDDPLADVFPGTLNAPLPHMEVFKLHARGANGERLSEIVLSPCIEEE